MTSGIYQIENVMNGRRYIGSAANIISRQYSHKYYFRKGKHQNRFLQRTWDKHGEKSLRFSTVLICSKDNLLLYEQLCINALIPEYNICMVAGSPKGTKRTEETKKAASIRMLGNSYKKGKKDSPETLLRKSVAQAGRIFSPEHIEKLRISSAGRTHSLESRMAISLSKKGKKLPAFSVEHRRKIGEANRRRKKCVYA